jgi:hypothetical protein
MSLGAQREPEFLAGRRRELQELYDACRTYDVIVITGWSGIGKTSFVKAGVMPMLTETGWHAIVNGTWVQLATQSGLNIGNADPEELAGRLYCALVDPQGEFSHAEGPLEVLTAMAAAHTRSVVIFDQFEELLRYLPAVARHLLELIGRTARDAQVPHIVIARSEYSERLRPVEALNTTTWTLRLGEIADDDVRRIMTVPAAPHVSIDEDAADKLLSQWVGARETADLVGARRVTVEGATEIGLLHFHAMLWSFKRWAIGQRVVDHVRVDHVEAFEQSKQVDQSGPLDALRLLEGSLADYVQEQAKHLWAAFTDPTGDGAATTMGAGIAAGWTDARVVEEMVLCLDLALKHMSRPDVNVLREVESLRQPIYELVHDGMGPALNSWAREFVVSDLAEVGVAAEQVGSALHANLRGKTLGGLDDANRALWGLGERRTGREVISNMLRPASLIASEEISDIVFKSCNFAGARFRAVTLRNVAFEDCNLTSALFENCTMRGVRFGPDPDSDASSGGEMSLLTIRFASGSDGQDQVEFVHPHNVLGLFLEGIRAGSWTFIGGRIRNLVITAGPGGDFGDATVRFTKGSKVSPLSAYGDVKLAWDADAASHVVPGPPPP